MKKKSAGFTVIELIIAIAITVIVLGVIYLFFFTSNKTLMTTDINSTLQTEGENIEKQLVFCGTQAKELLKVNSAVLQTSDILYSTLTGTKKLSIDNTGGEVKFFVEGDSTASPPTDDMNYTFKLDGTKLSLIQNKVVGTTETPVGNILLSENILSFNVRPLDINIPPVPGVDKSFKNAPGLEFTIVLQKKKGYSDVTYPVSTIVTFRNK